MRHALCRYRSIIAARKTQRRLYGHCICTHKGCHADTHSRGADPQLGRICYQAFKDLQDRHRFLVDFPSVQCARQVIGLLVTRPSSTALQQ